MDKENIFESSDVMIIDDEYMTESLAGRIIDKINEKKNEGFIKKTWNALSKKIAKETKTVSFNDKLYKDYKDTYETLCTTDSYMKYLQANTKIRKMFGVSEKGIVIWKFDVVKNEKDSHIIKMTYYHENKKCIIPNGFTLIHMSPIKGLRELEPSFRSKTKGRYFYPRKRVYFTIGKEINPKKAGIQGKTLYKYTPQKTYNVAYLDHPYASFNDGAVYINAESPIKVNELDYKNKKFILHDKIQDKENAKVVKEMALNSDLAFEDVCELIDILDEIINE